MGLTKFTFKPVPVKKSAPSAGSVAKSAIKKPSYARRRPIDDETSPMYGDELFQDSMRIEKLITISFFALTDNNITISKDRKFAIEYNPRHHDEEVEGTGHFEPVETWSLFYFKNVPSPLETFKEEPVYEIPKDLSHEFIECKSCTSTFLDKNCKLCAGSGQISTRLIDVENLEIIKDRLIHIVRFEYYSERKKFELENQSEVEENVPSNDAENITDGTSNDSADEIIEQGQIEELQTSFEDLPQEEKEGNSIGESREGTGEFSEKVVE